MRARMRSFVLLRLCSEDQAVSILRLRRAVGAEGLRGHVGTKVTIPPVQADTDMRGSE